jgi:glycosyltransferase involved in cell wall biosynthesis
VKLQLQVPAFDEAPTLGRVVEDCLRWGERVAGSAGVSVLIIDDGSRDATPAIARELARDPRVRVLRNDVRRGLGAAFRVGLDHARSSAPDVLVNVDADGQFPLEHLPRLVDGVRRGADVVLASRFLSPALTPSMRLGNALGNRGVSLLLSALCGRRFSDVSCGFRAYSSRAVAALELRGDFTYTHEVILVAQHLGLVLEEVALPIRGRREHGRSKVAGNRVLYGIQAGALIWETARRLRTGAERPALGAPARRG